MRTQIFPKLLAITLAAAALCGCQKRAEAPQTEEADAAPEPEKTPVAKVATPPPQAPRQPPTSAATPEPNYFAPEGVFFLTAAVSVETADSIVGLRPGARAVRQPDGRYQVEGHLVELRPDQITNDLRVARKAAGVDQAAKPAIRQSLQTRQPQPAGPAQSAPAAAPQAPTAPGESTPKFVDGVSTQKSGLQSSTSLGAAHTRTSNGIVWQKSPDGQWWVAVKRLNGKPLSGVSDQPAR